MTTTIIKFLLSALAFRIITVAYGAYWTIAVFGETKSYSTTLNVIVFMFSFWALGTGCHKEKKSAP